MNILYINHYAGSIGMGMEFRPYYLAREWQKMGHHVRIIAATYSHLRKVNPVVKRDFEVQQIESVEYQWIKTGVYTSNGLARATTMAQFCGKLWKESKSLAEEFRPDVVIASSTYPLDTYPAQRIRKFSGAKLIHEVHDMWPLTPVELYGMSRWHPFVIVMQMGENSFCRHVDSVVSILPAAKEYLQEHGMAAEKFCFIPNGVVLEDWQEHLPLPEEHYKVLEQARSKGRFILSFFGSHTQGYALDTLLEAAVKCDQDKLFVCFVGDGVYKDSLMRKAKDLGLQEKSCAFLPPIKKAEIPALINAIDASYVGATETLLFRFGIGMNKMFDAMMGGKPILYSVGAPNDYVNEFSCGISVKPGSSDALAEGLQRLMNMPEAERLVMGQNGHKAVIENFNYNVISRRFVEVMRA